MSRLSRPAAMGSSVAIASTAAVAALLSAQPASAAELACGQVIMTSTELTQDLVCPAGTDALVIGADGVVLDLKGFTVSGPGAYATAYSGVRAAQRTGVTITNGTITGFRSAVVLDQTANATVSKIVATDSDQALNLANATGSQILQNSVSGSGRDGIRLGGAHGSVVSQNVLTGNQWAITVSNTQGAVVSRNQVVGTRGTGVTVFDGSTGTTVSQNVVTASGEDGIRTTADTSGSLLLQNKTSFNGRHGIHAYWSTITKNTSTDNGGLGISAVSSTDGGGNKAALNGDATQCLGVVCTAP